MRLINNDHVAPPASDTNDNGDFSRNQFLAGRMALFQSGTYNLAPVAARARFRWGVAMLPTGPNGRVSVTNGIAAAGNSATKHPTRCVRCWPGWAAVRQRISGPHGAAIPAVLLAQPVYFDYWAAGRRRDALLRRAERAAHSRARAAPASPPGERAQSYFDEMFLGRGDVADILRQAQAAANAAAHR